MKKMKKRVFVLLVIILLFALAAPAYAELTEEEAKAAVEAQGKEAVSGNLLIWFLCAIAFLKVSQKIDSFMAMLGINVGRTGGGAFSDVIVAMRGVTGAAKMAGGGIAAAAGGRSGSSGAASAGRAAGAGGFAGGLAGMIARQAVGKTAEQATHDDDNGGIMAGIGGKLYDSSLGEKNGFAQEVISSVATGDGGVMSGDKAVDAFNAYMGHSVSGTGIQAGVGQGQTNAAQTQGQLQQGMGSPKSVSAYQENSDQKEAAAAFGSSLADGPMHGEASEIAYQTSMPDSVGNQGADQIDAGSVPEVSAAEVFGFADTSAVEYSSAVDPASDDVAGADGVSAEAIGGEAPLFADHGAAVSGGLESGADVYAPPLSSGTGVEQTGSAAAPSAGAAVYAPVPPSADYKDIEIGRGQIRGLEVSDQHPNGIKFAMYHTEKYMQPESGSFTTIRSADGAKWYKQYAEPTVKRTPVSESGGKVTQKESIVYELPKPPQRKDKV